MLIDSGSCPSFDEDTPNGFGSLAFEVHSCATDFIRPTTTFPASTGMYLFCV